MKQLPLTALLLTVLAVLPAPAGLAGETGPLPGQAASPASRETPAAACAAHGHRLQLEPGNSELIPALAKACRAAADPGAALDRLLPLLATHPSVIAYTTAVGLLIDYGATGDAAAIAGQGAARYPGDLELARLAASLLVQTDPAAAIGIINSALEHHPDNPELLTLLGRGYQQTRQWARAYAAYSTALTRDPTLKTAAAGRAGVLKHALVNGDTVLFPPGNQWIMDNQLIDRQTGETVLLLKVAADTPAEAAKGFVLGVFPGAGTDNIPLIEQRPADHPGTAFALAGIATPELVENKIHYALRSAAYALAFSAGNDQLVLGVRQSSRKPAEALAFVSELLAAVVPAD